MTNIGAGAGDIITMETMTGSTSEKQRRNRKGTTTMAVAMIKTTRNKKNHMKNKRVSMIDCSRSRLS